VPSGCGSLQSARSTHERDKEKIFLITGASAGFGRAFAEAAVEARHTVIGTVRREDDRVDLTDALKAGVNHLEIKVVNTWVNRLIGDKQPGATRITFTAAPTYQADAPLRPSGLLGTVQVLSVTPALERSRR